MLWNDGDERRYPLGVEDPDYSVLCFAARRGNYYHRLKNITFEIE
jgi:general stress protein 26